MKQDSEGFHIKVGSIPYIKDINYTVENNIKYPELHSIPYVSEPEFEPYDYQSKSVKELIKVRHGNVELPTGAGKSHIVTMLTQQIGKDILIVTPSKSIFSEIIKELQTRFGKSKVGGYGDGKKDIKKPITVAISRSLTMLKKDTPQYDFFAKKQTLIIDEAHTFAAETLEKVCHGVLKDAPFRFFMTATIARGDGLIKPLQSIIGKTVVSMTIKEAIEDGFLCPLRFNLINTFSPSTAVKRDPIVCKRTHFLYNNEIAKFIAKLSNAMWNLKQESTLILVEELIQIQMLTKLIKVPFGYIHSASKKDAAEWGLEKVKLLDELEKFNKGDYKILIGTKSISTGTNIYPTFNTVNWVGGGSEIVTKQGSMGRSTRWMKDRYKKFHKEKTQSTIWDFNVEGQYILERQLRKRIEYYEETGETVNILK